MWCIWWERNNQHFEDSEKTVSDLKLFFFKILLDWVAMLVQNFSLLLSASPMYKNSALMNFHYLYI